MRTFSSSPQQNNKNGSNKKSSVSQNKPLNECFSHRPSYINNSSKMTVKTSMSVCGGFNEIKRNTMNSKDSIIRQSTEINIETSPNLTIQSARNTNNNNTKLYDKLKQITSPKSVQKESNENTDAYRIEQKLDKMKEKIGKAFQIYNKREQDLIEENKALKIKLEKAMQLLTKNGIPFGI